MSRSPQPPPPTACEAAAAAHQQNRGGGATAAAAATSSLLRPGNHPSSSSSSSSSPPSSSPPSIGLNLRVTGYCNQGGRKYMEDVFSVAYQQTEDEKDLEYAFFGIFDGHGGREAAVFAKEHLMDFIVRQKNFWIDEDDAVLRAIHEGFVQTHQAMWKELETWPKTASGLPSTAGTTASVAFIRRGKIYIGHVGDSAIVLGVQDPVDRDSWICQPLTRDHKPESQEESKRIQESGGKVVCKSGVPRVVWNRPRMGHRGPVRRSTHIDEIPFLAVARSLGDLWSYNSEEDVFVVSPEPDTYVYPIDISRHRCLILGTDGAWNMLTPPQAVRIVCEAEKSNEQHMLNPSAGRQWINPSKRLVDKAIEKWTGNNLRADNTSVVTVMLDPPGPPRAQVLKRQRELAQLGGPHLGALSSGPLSTAAVTGRVINADRGSVALVTNTTPEEPEASSSSSSSSPPHPAYPRPPLQPVGTNGTLPGGHPPVFPAVPSSHLPSSHIPSNVAHTTQDPSSSADSKGVSIISRFPNSKSQEDMQGQNLAEAASSSSSRFATGLTTRKKQQVAASSSSSSLARLTTSTAVVDSTTMSSGHNHGWKRGQQVSSRQATSPSQQIQHHHQQQQQQGSSDDDIQCNVVSSSDDDSPVKAQVVGAKKRQGRGARGSSRLSRELSALQLDSPSVLTSRRRGGRRHHGDRVGVMGRRARTRSETETSEEEESNGSDVENEVGGVDVNRREKRQLRSSSGPRSDVEMHCRELTAKIRNIERKVAKKARQLNQEVRFLQTAFASADGATTAAATGRSGSTNPHFLRSSHHQLPPQQEVEKTPPTRCLRPRTPSKALSASAPPPSRSTPGSSRKRKGLVVGAPQAPLAKSPKTAVAVQGSRPVVTRSRTARVLQLRHK